MKNRADVIKDVKKQLNRITNALQDHFSDLIDHNWRLCTFFFSKLIIMFHYHLSFFSCLYFLFFLICRKIMKDKDISSNRYPQVYMILTYYKNFEMNRYYYVRWYQLDTLTYAGGRRLGKFKLNFFLNRCKIVNTGRIVGSV